MKVQNSDPQFLSQIASDNAWAMIDLVVNHDMTINQAVEAQIDGMMNDSFDDDEFNTPYDKAQCLPIFRAALIETLKNSATELRNYANAHPENHKRYLDGENEIGEEVVVHVINLDGTEYQVVYDDNEDYFFEGKELTV